MSVSDRKLKPPKHDLKFGNWEWRDTVDGPIQNIASAVSSLMFVLLLEPPERKPERVT